MPFDFGGIVQIVSGFYFDNNAEGYVDSIYVEATTDIAGGLTDAHITELIDKALTLPAFRGFTVNSSGVTTGGFYMKVTEDNGHNPVTYVTNDDKIEVISVALNAGGQVLAATVDIIDKKAVKFCPKFFYFVFILCSSHGGGPGPPRDCGYYRQGSPDHSLGAEERTSCRLSGRLKIRYVRCEIFRAG